MVLGRALGIGLGLAGGFTHNAFIKRLLKRPPARHKHQPYIQRANQHQPGDTRYPARRSRQPYRPRLNHKPEPAPGRQPVAAGGLGRLAGF